MPKTVNAKTIKSFRLSTQTLDDIATLATQRGASEAEIIAIAVDRMKQQEIETMDNWTPELLKSRHTYVKVKDRGGHTYYGSIIDIGDRTASVTFGGAVLQNVPLQAITDAKNNGKPLDISKL